MPRWLGWLSFVPAILLGWVATLMEFAGGEAAVDPIVGVGVLAFTGWFLSMGVVLIRWMPEDKISIRDGSDRLTSHAADGARHV